MKPWSMFSACMLALSLGLASTSAMADDDCDVPMERWQSREAVSQMAAHKGWDVQRLKIDDGCYEIRGSDLEGRSFKAKIDPETLQVVKIKYRDRDRSRDREYREDARPGSGIKTRPNDGNTQTPEAATPMPGANTLFAPGSTPRGQIE